MSVPPVQTFGDDHRVHDGLSHGILVVEESGDPIRVLWGDEDEEGDDYVVDLILPLRDQPGHPPRVAVCSSEPNSAPYPAGGSTADL